MSERISIAITASFLPSFNMRASAITSACAGFDKKLIVRFEVTASASGPCIARIR